MSVDANEVAHIASLVRLDLTDKEKETFSEQLNAILQVADKLNEVDITNVEPTTHGLSELNVMREDEIKASLPLDKVFLNAPDEEDGHFKVPAVLE